MFLAKNFYNQNLYRELKHCILPDCHSITLISLRTRTRFMRVLSPWFFQCVLLTVWHVSKIGPGKCSMRAPSVVFCTVEFFANGDTNANGYNRGITAESPTISIALRGLQCLFKLENNHCTKSMK